MLIAVLAATAAATSACGTTGGGRAYTGWRYFDNPGRCAELSSRPDVKFEGLSGGRCRAKLPK
jgi:hypothetical protein